MCPCSSEDRALASGARSAGSSPARGTIMGILLPYFESDRLKNGSVITSSYYLKTVGAKLLR